MSSFAPLQISNKEKEKKRRRFALCSFAHCKNQKNKSMTSFFLLRRRIMWRKNHVVGLLVMMAKEALLLEWGALKGGIGQKNKMLIVESEWDVHQYSFSKCYWWANEVLHWRCSRVDYWLVWSLCQLILATIIFEEKFQS